MADTTAGMLTAWATAMQSLEARNPSATGQAVVTSCHDWFSKPWPAQPDALPAHCTGADSETRECLERLLAEPGAALVRPTRWCPDLPERRAMPLHSS